MATATYEEIKELSDSEHPEKLLIDVRNNDEINQTGLIPNSINIPLISLEEALQMADEDFKNKYGCDKPTKDKIIIFTCRSGARASKAAQCAICLQFNNVKVYQGSWLEWSQKEGLSPN